MKKIEITPVSNFFVAVRISDLDALEQQRDEAVNELINAHDMLCFLCVRLNPQHKYCTFCNDVKDIQKVITNLTGQTWEEIKAGKE